MTKTEIATMIASFGFNWRYSHFSETPTPPYIVYYYPNDADVYADNSNFINKRALFIELYTEKKDEASEAAVTAKLAEAGLTWYKQTDYLNDEKLYQTTFETEVFING